MTLERITVGSGRPDGDLPDFAPGPGAVIFEARAVFASIAKFFAERDVVDGQLHMVVLGAWI